MQTAGTAAFAYNLANQVTQVVNSPSSCRYDYSYYPDGNQSGKIVLRNGETMHTAYTYDPMSRLKQEKIGSDAVVYTYDRFSNRSTMETKGFENAVTRYIYNKTTGCCWRKKPPVKIQKRPLTSTTPPATRFTRNARCGKRRRTAGWAGFGYALPTRMPLHG